MRACVVLVAGFAFVGLANRTGAGDPQKGLGELRGTWEVTKKEGQFEPSKLIFDGDKMTVVLGEDKKGGSIKIDPKAKPPQIDMIGQKEKKERFLGIYEVSGDTLRICFAAKGDKRPSEFKSIGDDIILVTLKRVKK